MYQVFPCGLRLGDSRAGDLQKAGLAICKRRHANAHDTSILFRTNHNDKDPDTNVAVEVWDNTGEFFARISDTFDKFHDHRLDGHSGTNHRFRTS